jgi:hypothetical protein
MRLPESTFEHQHNRAIPTLIPIWLSSHHRWHEKDLKTKCRWFNYELTSFIRLSGNNFIKLFTAVSYEFY